MAMGFPEPDQLSNNIREQFLQCKICLDGMKEPKTLPCLHTFCADCLHYYIGHNRLDGRKFACPICRRHIYIPKNGVDGFPDSFFLINLNDIVLETETKVGEASTSAASDCGICRFKEEKVPAKVMCAECKINLCETCQADHAKSKITQGHTLLPVQKEAAKSRENYCRVHKTEVVKYYCETCNCPICLPCTFLDHKEHSVLEIKNIRDSFRADIEGLVNRAAEIRERLLGTSESLQYLENELFSRKETLKQQIRMAVQEMVRDLQDQERQLKTQIDEHYETIVLARDRQKLERVLSRLSSAHDFAQQLLSPETSPVTQLIYRRDAKLQLEDALSFEAPDPAPHRAKLDTELVFLPGGGGAGDLSAVATQSGVISGRISGLQRVNVGCLLSCSSATNSGPTLTQLPMERPSSRAMFLQRLRPPESDCSMGDVLALAFLPNNSLAILTSHGKKVKIYDSRGRFKLAFGDDGDITHPSDFTVSNDGELAITDCDLPGVRLYTPYGTPGIQFGDENMFSLPISICTDALGRLIVLDQDKRGVTVHSSSNGDLVRELPLDDNVLTPQLVCWHTDKLYVSDFQHDSIHIYNTHRDNTNINQSETIMKEIARLHTHEQEDGHFLDCSGMVIEPKSGNLLVADMATDRIHCLNPRGQWSHIVASGQQFLHPTSMALSSSGLIAVAGQGSYILESSERDMREDEEGEEEREAVELEEAPFVNHVSLYRIVKADI